MARSWERSFCPAPIRFAIFSNVNTLVALSKANKSLVGKRNRSLSHNGSYRVISDYNVRRIIKLQYVTWRDGTLKAPLLSLTSRP